MYSMQHQGFIFLRIKKNEELDIKRQVFFVLFPTFNRKNYLFSQIQPIKPLKNDFQKRGVILQENIHPCATSSLNQYLIIHNLAS